MAEHPPVLAFDAEAARVADVAGGKGASLSRLSSAGLPVPSGFVVTSTAFETFLAGRGGSARIAGLIGGLDVHDTRAVEAAAAQIHDAIVGAAMPADLTAAIRAAHDRLEHGSLVAVRSSAVSEDGVSASFAGQQESYLNVRGADEILRRIQECWASFFSPRALFYRAQKADLADTRMAVVVQEMVQAEKSGVMFTVDPIRHRRDCMVIEAAPGLGDAIVSGEITPDHYVVSRAGGDLLEEFLPDEERGRVLDGGELDGLRSLGLRVEAFFGSPQDVEWCIRGGEILLLQSRPITTLGRG